MRAIETALKGAKCTCRIVPAASADHWPMLEIVVDPGKLGVSAFEVCRRLRAGSPPVYVGHGKLAEGVLVVSPTCVQTEQWPELERLLREVLM
ncbi:MAG: hypothetical protein U0992_24515 [Planctomycetaceae bacterium]